MPTTLPGQIDERSAAVARIDGGVGLQEILVHVHVQPGAPLGADDAVRDRTGQSEGRADRQHAIADLHRVGVAEFQRLKAGVLDIEHNDGDIGAAIAADVLRRELAAVQQIDHGSLRPFDDVIIGDDDAGRIGDEAGAEPEAIGIVRRHEAWIERGLDDNGPGLLGGVCLNADDGGKDALDDVAVRGQFARQDGCGLRLTLRARADEQRAAAESDGQKKDHVDVAFHVDSPGLDCRLRVAFA